MRRLLLLLTILCFIDIAQAQKTPYIPAFLLDPNTIEGSQFTWTKTAQSDNFTIIWGNTVGLDPTTASDPSLAFDPSKILDTMEYLYTAIKQTGFLNDSAGTKLAQYKIPIVMYNTWGPGGIEGFATGGAADGIIGTFTVHPIAMQDGKVAAHEFTHSLQAQNDIDYRTTYGFGPAQLATGIFWETHANFMRSYIYPDAVSAWGMDVYHLETWGDWKNTYENYELLFAIEQSEGMEMINRMWREAYSYEYPIQAYKRLAGYNQATFNDSMYGYVRRMATFDFPHLNVGSSFRQARSNDLQNYLPTIQAAYNILKRIPGTTDHYEIPIEQAPEEYAYNLIPLHVNPDSCAVIMKFKGHTDANAHAGWRYGFVTEKPDGTVSRYSPTYSDTTKEISFELQSGEAKMYFMVMGASFDNITTDTSNDTWHGYPKHFRFPYEVVIHGAVPEGYQDAALFRAQLKTAGAPHTNGGGWVESTASVAASVFVDSSAMVLGNANITGNARIENTAVVKDASVAGNVHISNNAFVVGGTYDGNAQLRGHSYTENVMASGNAIIGMRAHVANYTLAGNIEVGGDVVVYNSTGSCNNGVYYVLTNYYDDKLLECDNRTASHPANADVNNTYAAFTNSQMAMACNCSTIPNCFTLGIQEGYAANKIQFSIFPNPATNSVTVSSNETAFISIIDLTGRALLVTESKGKQIAIDISSIPAGIYFITLKSENGEGVEKLIIQ